eukprot:366477-Chlamydomonas_euryale.AAC.6
MLQAHQCSSSPTCFAVLKHDGMTWPSRLSWEWPWPGGLAPTPVSSSASTHGQVRPETIGVQLCALIMAPASFAPAPHVPPPLPDTCLRPHPHRLGWRPLACCYVRLSWHLPVQRSSRWHAAGCTLDGCSVSMRCAEPRLCGRRAWCEVSGVEMACSG